MSSLLSSRRGFGSSRRLPGYSLANCGVALLLLTALLVLSGCRYPTDIEHSLENIRGKVLNVGLTENPPWVMRSDNGPAGLEPEIVAALAEELDAEVHWHWGSESALLQALEERQLHLVIGGLTKHSRLSELAAPTKPYHESVYTVGYPSDTEVPASLKDENVAIHPVNHFIKALRDEGANPQRHTELADADTAVAAPIWWLQAHGFKPGEWELATDQHVMALPKGENAWMLTVQRHLDDQTHIGQRLQQLEADR